MNLKPTDSESDKVFLAPHEYEFAIEFAEEFDKRARLAARIMGESGPRIGKTSELKRGDIYVPDAEKIEIAIVEIEDAKDTTDDGENYDADRISHVPQSLHNEIESYCQSNRIGEEDEIFDIQEDRLETIINQELSAALVDKTDNEDWLNLSTHDFRRYFANHSLRRKNLSEDVVKEQGAWSSDKAIEPYKETLTVRDLQDELARQDAAEIDLPHPHGRHGDIEEIHNRLDNIEKALEIRDIADELSALTREDISKLKEMANAQKGSLRDLADDFQASIDEFDEDDLSQNKATLDIVKPAWVLYSKKVDAVREKIAAPIARLWDDKIGIFPGDVLKRSTRTAVLSFLVIATPLLAWFGLVLRANGFVLDPWAGIYEVSRQSLIGLVIATYCLIVEMSLSASRVTTGGE